MACLRFLDGVDLRVLPGCCFRLEETSDSLACQLGFVGDDFDFEQEFGADELGDDEEHEGWSRVWWPCLEWLLLGDLDWVGIVFGVGVEAAPGPVFGLLDQAGFDWVAVHVA